MVDQQRWDLAWAKFGALQRNIPGEVDRTRIAEYHQILTDLQATSGEDLSHFRIPDAEVKPQIIFALSSSGGPGQTGYGESLCDRDFFVRQIQGVSNYIATRKELKRSGGNVVDANDYSVLQDWQLQDLMVKYRIRPSKRVDAGGEHFYFDRESAIEALQNRDAPRHLRSTASTTHVVNVQNMYGSSIQQNTHGSPVNIVFKYDDADLQRVLDLIKNSLDAIDLGDSDRKQLHADIVTAQVQRSSPSPKSVIITQCLHSMRAVLEGVAGSMIASGLVSELTKLLGK